MVNGVGSSRVYLTFILVYTLDLTPLSCMDTPRGVTSVLGFLLTKMFWAILHEREIEQ